MQWQPRFVTDRLEATQKRPFLSLRISRHFATPPLVSPRNDVWEDKRRNSRLMTRHYPDLGNTGWKFSPSIAEALPRFSFQGRRLKVFFAIRANIARRAKNLTEVKGKGADTSRVFSYHFKLNGCGRLFRELNERDDGKEAERLDRNTQVALFFDVLLLQFIYLSKPCPRFSVWSRFSFCPAPTKIPAN